MSEFNIGRRVLRPPIIRILGNNYRVLSEMPEESGTTGVESTTSRVSVGEASVVSGYVEPEVEVEGVTQKDGYYELCVEEILPCFHRFLVGPKGTTQQKVEQDFGVKLRVPKAGESDHIVISATELTNVVEAKKHLEFLVELHRKKASPTHFVNFSLYNSSVERSFEQFKRQVFEHPNSKELPAGLFVSARKLHVTVLVLVLPTRKDASDASRALAEVVSRRAVELSLREFPLEVIIQGLEIMNDDPSRVSVLFAKVSSGKDASDNRLQRLADGILSDFLKLSFSASPERDEQGEAEAESASVKIHVTLMKSRRSNIRKKPNATTVSSAPFDATHILQNWRDHYFGCVRIDSVHLCSISTTSPLTGYYESEFHCSL